MFAMITTSLSGFTVLFFVVLAVAAHLWLRSRQRCTNSSPSVDEKTPFLHGSTGDQQNEKTDEVAIVHLSGFDWKTTEPLKLRPFKPKYHITMGTVIPSFVRAPYVHRRPLILHHHRPPKQHPLGPHPNGQ